RNSHLLGYRPTHQRLLDPRRSLLPPEPVSTLIRADRRDRNLLSSRRLSEWCAVTRAARELQTLSTPGVFKFSSPPDGRFIPVDDFDGGSGRADFPAVQPYGTVAEHAQILGAVRDDDHG